ncbi:hypothetical protein [Flavimobilis soli]|nr:hypothetical protein [Flavimobilis soli]
MRRSIWQLIGFVISALYALGFGLLAIVGLLFLGLRDDISDDVVALGSLLVVVWTVGPLVAFGVDDTFEPRRLAQFPLSTRDLMLGTGVAALAGPGGLVTVLVSLGFVAAWVSQPVALVAALVGAALGLVTAVVGSRATTSAVRPLLEGRRGRDLMLGATVVGVSLVGPAIVLFSGAEIEVTALAHQTAPVLAWTPFGAPYALPAAVAAGSWGAALAHLAIAVASPVLLILWWRRSLERTLVRPSRVSAGRGRGLGVLGRVPDSQLGAVLARCLTYWVRDPRYVTSLLSIPVVVILLVLFAGNGTWLLVGGPLIAWSLGWAISTDVALDSTAFWTHVAAPMGGAPDRWGRALAIGVPGLVLSLGVAVGTLAYADRWDATAAVVGATVGTLLAALGLASIVSAMVVFPVTAPGENPFASKQGGSLAALLSQTVGSLALLLVLSPTLVVAVVAIVKTSAVLSAVSGVLGLATGVVALMVGMKVGARRLEDGAPELLARLRSF